MEKPFEICVRAVIIKDNKVLVCQQEGKDYFFFPGGHVEFGEKAEEALKREVQEEISQPVAITEFIGSNENYFIQDGEEHHEFNLVFLGEIGEEKVETQEDHLIFVWKDLNSIQKEKIYPLALQQKLRKWLENKKIFWSSQFPK